MTGFIVNARLACLVVTCLAPAFAQTWTSPVVLSTGGQGWEATAAIDGNGNSVALWDERTSLDQLWSRARPGGGNWETVAEVSGALETSSPPLPAVRISAAGFATAVWSDQTGVWTADRPPGSSWNSPRLLIPGASNPIFVMNSQGAAAVAWTVGGPSSTSSSVMAVVRPAGGAWTSEQIVASGAHVSADHAGIGAGGAVIVTWETFNAVCKKYGCALSAFALHASRQNPGGDTWVDSGSLLGPDSASHDARVALNSAGGAMLVAVNSSGAYTSATQGNSGGVWSAFKSIVNPQGLTITSDLASDDAGQVTLVYEFIGFSTSQAFAVNGSTSSNTWTSPAILSGSDTNVGQVYLAVAPSGAALAVWLNSSATPAVRASIRATATGAWGSVATVSGPGNEIGPEAVAVNSSGNAVVVYSGYNSSGVHTEYATNH